MFKKLNRIQPVQIIIIGFASLILIGTFLLMLPISTKNGQGASFIDALFTATSASCVTGLIVHDTYQYWSIFGQAVLIGLIQIGGMGVVTMAILISIFGGKKIGLKQRWTMQQSISAPQVGGIIRNTKWIFRAALCIEFIGMILLAIRFLPQFGILKGLWYSFFHSISSFCNAGFDLMGYDQAYSSLTNYTNDWLVPSVVGLLIVIGGLGFFVWEDIVKYKFKLKKYSLQSKVVLTTTISLILVGAFYFYFFELRTWDLSFSEKINAAFFQSISPRTAGYNTVDLAQFSSASQFFMILLMLIGGSPGSTAGGFKTTTFVVLLLSIRAIFKNKQNPQCFNRRIPDEALHSAAALFTLFIFLFLFGGFFISIHDHIDIVTALFESASAIGTVGLTLGITPTLSTASHLVLICLMFFGRVGGLTLLLAIRKNQIPTNANLPQENISIG